jgi:sulfur carrier protein
MKVELNGKAKELSENITLKSLVENVAAKPQRTIAEVNGDIVQALQWEEVNLQEGDKIELVSFVGGG